MSLSARQHWRRGRYSGYPVCCILFVVCVTTQIGKFAWGLRLLAWYRDRVVVSPRGYVVCPLCLRRKRPFLDPCMLAFYDERHHAEVRRLFRVGAVTPCDQDGNPPPSGA